MQFRRGRSWRLLKTHPLTDLPSRYHERRGVHTLQGCRGSQKVQDVKRFIVRGKPGCDVAPPDLCAFRPRIGIVPIYNTRHFSDGRDKADCWWKLRGRKAFSEVGDCLVLWRRQIEYRRNEADGAGQ